MQTYPSISPSKDVTNAEISIVRPDRLIVISNIENKIESYNTRKPVNYIEKRIVNDHSGQINK